jgi:aminopeptidase N
MLVPLLTLVVGTTEGRADTYPRNSRVDVQHYAFTLALQDGSDRIAGETAVDVLFAGNGETSLRFDLINLDGTTGTGMTVDRVTAQGVPVAFVHRDHALTITLHRRFADGERVRVLIAYAGEPASGLKIAANRYGDRTFFSDNWPDKARHWLPTIDHPYDKATSEMIVTAPSHYQVVSNGLLVEETDLPENRRRTHWRQSIPIASWLYVLGVARFAVQHVDTFDGKAIQTWVYAQDRDKGFHDFAVPTRAALAFYSDKVGPFSYEKLANVQSNSVSGGMEAASAIFYSESSVTGDRSVRWRNVIIHEVAHQWFGNAVTESDWDDVWLSEGFATYFTLLFIEHAYGRDAFVDGLRSSRERVLRFHADNPAYRIVHDNLSDMGQVTTSQTYQKGAWTLHMLRGVVGDDAFWQGIQSYYREYQDRNATTADFRRHMEEASGMDLGWFFQQLLYQGGSIKLRGGWRYDRQAGNLVVELAQVQDDAGAFRMPLALDVYLEGEDAPRRETVQLGELEHTFTIAVDSAPERVVLDPDLWVLMETEFEPRN